jgi:NADH:ubiquinone oxidoreductase subunit K
MALTDILSLPTEQMFQGFFLPFLLVFAILWGLLSTLRVFNRKINIVLSIVLTILAASTPQFVLFSTYVTQLSAQVVIAAFFILFAFGAIVWAVGGGKKIVYEQTGLTKDKINKQLAKYYKKYREAKEEGNKEKMKTALDEIKKLEMERDVAD